MMLRNATSPEPPPVSASQVSTVQDGLRRLERVDWSLLVTAIILMLLLAFGLHSYTLVPAPSRSVETLHHISFGLIGLVLVFALFAVHKHILVNRLRHQLASQMNLAAALQSRAEVFHKLAILDPLTGLYNRRFVMQQLPVEMARSERCGYRLTALMMDLNGLKAINDQHSHLAGDLALREFATAIRKAIRSSDVAVRLGGDEFLVILPDCDAGAVERILARLTDLSFTFRGTRVPITYAAGWAEYTEQDSPEELLARADQKLYQDKQTGSAVKRARAANDDLREAEKMELMGRFTGTVAHEFNNLLTTIKGYSELLMQRAGQSAGPSAALEHIHRAAERAGKLTGQLLAFSRRQGLDPRPLNLPYVLSAMDMLLQRLVGERIQLTISAESGVHNIIGDEGQMQQVIMYLLFNARSAIARQGSIGIEISDYSMDSGFVAANPGSRVGHYVRVTVRDSGKRRNESACRHLFEPWSCAAAQDRPRLGLATVYGVLKQMGGYILIESQEGDGNRVTIFLPWAEAAADAVAAAPEPVPVAVANVEGRRVLVVENFDGLREFMRDCLQESGYPVLEAANGEQAIQMVADSEQPLHVLICDVVLPGMSGLELADCITAQSRNIQVLYIAGYSEDANLYREWLHGSGHFLAAPFSTDDLRRELAQMERESLKAAIPARPQHFAATL